MKPWVAPLAGLAGLMSWGALATGVAASPPSGGWVFDTTPDFPGFTRVVISHGEDGWSGKVTSRWYGDLPMLSVREKGDSLVFRLSNGNAAVPMTDIVIKRQSGELRMTGKLWYAAFDIIAHRAGAEALRALDFPTYPLPPRRVVPDRRLAPLPPMGWSSWNRFGENIDDRSVREIADALVSSGLRDAGYVYVNIDDGWQGARDVQGRLEPNRKFPDMKALADYVHARGLKLGIYTSPGPKSCAGFEGAYGHVGQDAETFAAWGVDYLKYDLCSGEAFYNTAESIYAAYQEMGEALAATHRDIVYSLCEYGRFDVGAWGHDVGGDLWRTTGDIADNYATMATIGFDKTRKLRPGGPNGWNDLDMLEVGNGGMTGDEYRTHMALWALKSAPFILGDDVRSMSPETTAILKNREVIAVDQDPAAAPAAPTLRVGGVEIMTKALKDGATAVGFFNRGEQAYQIAGPWRTIVPGPPGRIRDLWAQADLPLSDHFDFSVPKHGVVLLRISPSAS
jgi:alpha-galactosidase